MSPRTLRIRAEFLGAATFSGHTPSGAPEWPPSPSRLFAALVAGAGADRTDNQSRALLALENTSNPLIIATAHLTVGPAVPHYVARESVSVPATGHVDMVRQKKLLGARFTEASQFPTGSGGEASPFGDNVVVVDGVDYILRVADESTTDATAKIAATLDDVASQVTYFGRSTDQASITVTDITDEVGGGAHALHGFTASLAGETGRVVWVPSAQSRTVLSGWTPGLLTALDARHSGELEGTVYPHPAYLTPQIAYRPVTGATTVDPNIAVAHLEEPLTGLRAGHLLDIIPTDACAMFAPGGADSTRSRVAHISVTGDVDTLPGRMESLGAALATEGLAFEWEPEVPDLAKHYLTEATLWTTMVPASGFGPAPYAAATFAADIAEQTGVDANLLNVTAVPPSDKATRVHRPSVGGRLWDVTVSSPVPLKGPLRIGDTTGGILVRVGFTPSGPFLENTL